MPGRTKEVTIDNALVTIARPTFMEFRSLAVKVSALLEIEFDAAMSTPEFQQVLEACTVDASEFLQTADYASVARLWDEIIAFGEFESFFAERQTQHFTNSKRRLELEVDLQAAQFNRMKAAGLLPESFSLDHVLATGEQNLTSLPSSSTITPAGTGGRVNPSNERTTGLSSGTSPRPRAAAKR